MLAIEWARLGYDLGTVFLGCLAAIGLADFVRGSRAKRGRRNAS